jgi:hypothetical protein
MIQEHSILRKVDDLEVGEAKGHGRDGGDARQ